MPCRDSICGADLGPHSISIRDFLYLKAKGKCKRYEIPGGSVKNFLFFRGSWRSCILLLAFLGLATQSNHLFGTECHGKSPLLTSRDTHDHAI